MPNKALLVGINDYKYVTDLRGCHNDVTNMRDILITYFNFAAENISVLVDSSATKDRILMRMEWLFTNVQPGDHVIFHFSGHGSQIRDFDGDEKNRILKDENDELICLYDMDWRNKNSYFVDDELKAWTKKLPKGVKLTVVIDSCHSGTVTKAIFDPPWEPGPTIPPVPPIPLVAFAIRYVEPPMDIKLRIDERRPTRVKRILCKRDGEDMNHILLAACRDDQTSADAYIASSFNGAFTYYLCKTIRDIGKQLTYDELIARVRQSLKFNKYDQIPQTEGPKTNQQIFI